MDQLKDELRQFYKSLDTEGQRACRALWRGIARALKPDAEEENDNVAVQEK